MKQLLFVILAFYVLTSYGQKEDFVLRVKVKNEFNSKKTSSRAILMNNYLPEDTVRMAINGVYKFKLKKDQYYVIEIQQESYFPILLSINTVLNDFEITQNSLSLDIKQIPIKKMKNTDYFHLPVKHLMFNPYKGELVDYPIYSDANKQRVDEIISKSYNGYTKLLDEDEYDKLFNKWNKEKAKLQAQLISKGLMYVNQIDSSFMAKDKLEWLSKFEQPEIDTLIELELLEEQEVKDKEDIKYFELLEERENEIKEGMKLLSASDSSQSEDLEAETKLYKIQNVNVQQSYKTKFEQERYEQEIEYKENVVNNLKKKSRLIYEIAATKKEQELELYKEKNPFD